MGKRKRLRVYRRKAEQASSVKESYYRTSKGEIRLKADCQKALYKTFKKKLES